MPASVCVCVGLFARANNAMYICMCVHMYICRYVHRNGVQKLVK